MEIQRRIRPYPLSEGSPNFCGENTVKEKMVMALCAEDTNMRHIHSPFPSSILVGSLCLRPNQEKEEKRGTASLNQATVAHGRDGDDNLNLSQVSLEEKLVV